MIERLNFDPNSATIFMRGEFTKTKVDRTLGMMQTILCYLTMNLILLISSH